MRRTVRRLVVILSFAALLAAIVPAVGPAAVLAVPCGNPKVVLYEDGGGGGDSITYCNGKGNADLRTHPHVPAGDCRATFDPPGDTWNDCVSSYRPTIPAGSCLYLYRDVGHTAPMGVVSGPVNGALFNLTLLNNDVLSSFRWKAKVGGVCPAA